ncbi:RraA family protein [Aquabacter sp. CN5-332]|uniref:RraA family protein n=1 Tax=Aquabacter sp. CN5-332 TaxID=3156608 RepID=UPI0032B42A10
MSNADTALRVRKQLLGKVPPEAVRRMEIERLPREVVEGFARLVDLTGTVSDSMDNLGLTGTIPASVLPPASPGKRVAGQAITVRNVERQTRDFPAAQEGRNLMGEQEAYNLAEPGDVVVIEGIFGVSNMGGQSATLAHRQGCAGAVIDGSYRDPDASRELGFPIWARGVTPITGKWRLETVEINGRVRIAGFSVEAGDLVLADDAGIVFVPFAHAAAVLKEAQRIDAADTRRKQDIEGGADLHALAGRKYK